MLENMGLRVLEEVPYRVDRERPRRDVDPRFRRDARRRRADRPDARARSVPGGLRARLDRRDGERRLQPPGARRRARLARGHGAARLSPNICARPASRSARTTWRRRWRAIRASRASWSSCSWRASIRATARAKAAPSASWARSRRRSTASPTSTRTASSAASSTSCSRRCAPTIFQDAAEGPGAAPDAKSGPSPISPSSSTAARSTSCRCRGRCFEIFVYAPRVEGVHLRGGKVARGGIRWSDRREDFRTEILGLMKAQMVKNAVIVPVGSKGGFVVKRPPAPAPTPGRPRGARRRGHRLLQDLDARPARPHRQSRGRQRSCRRRARRAPRRRRSLSRGRRRQGHRDLLRHRQRRRRRVRLLARRRLRLGRLGRLRPQEDGHHRARRLGSGEAPFPRARHRHPEPGLHRRRRRRHVGRRVRQRHAAVAAHQAGRRLRPPAHLHRSRPRPESELRRAPAAVRAAALDLDRLRPGADLASGGGVFERTRQVDRALGRGARALRHHARARDARRADPRHADRAGRPALVRRHRHLRQGAPRKPRRGRRPRQRRRSASTARRLRAQVVGEGANLGVTQRGRIEYALLGRAHQHRRHRQFGRRRHLRPRGQHQDRARRRRSLPAT